MMYMYIDCMQFAHWSARVRVYTVCDCYTLPPYMQTLHCIHLFTNSTLFVLLCGAHALTWYTCVYTCGKFAESISHARISSSSEVMRRCSTCIASLCPRYAEAERKRESLEEGRKKSKHKEAYSFETVTYLWLWHSISHLNEPSHIRASRTWVESRMTWM